MKEPAHVAYDAYRDCLMNNGFHQMSMWGELTETERQGWRAAVAAVL